MWNALQRALFRSLLPYICAIIPLLASAQTKAKPDRFDSLYVRDYSRMITGRGYLSTKYNKMVLQATKGTRELVYRPNNRYNIGVGTSYRAITLNIGVGIPGVNNDQDEKGTTRYLDAQANIYTKRWATNLFLQEFRGYYLSSYTKDEVGWHQATEYPTRPDLRQRNLGVSTVYVFNNNRFSYRAAFNQDAWQRKSQGSFLAGGYFTLFSLRADSSLVPARLAALYKTGLHLRKSNFMDVGASAGYTYTLVIKEHWFITASGVLGGGLSSQQATTGVGTHIEQKSTTGSGWHAQFRAGAGYNSARYYAGLTFNQENIGYVLKERSSFYWSVGNIRLNFAKRF